MASPKLGLQPAMGAVELLDGVVRPVVDPVGAGPIILVVLLIAARCGPPT